MEFLLYLSVFPHQGTRDLTCVLYHCVPHAENSGGPSTCVGRKQGAKCSESRGPSGFGFSGGQWGEGEVSVISGPQRPPTENGLLTVTPSKRVAHRRPRAVTRALFARNRADQSPSGRGGRAGPTDFLWLLQKQQSQKYYKTTPCICAATESCGKQRCILATGVLCGEAGCGAHST